MLPIAASPTQTTSASSTKNANGTIPLLSTPSRLRRRRPRPARHPNFKGMPCLLASFGFICLLFFSLNASIYSALNEQQEQLLQYQIMDQESHLVNASLDRPQIVIFAAPRPFTSSKPDLVYERQEMAVRSWLALSPDVSVMLFGQHPSIFTAASSLGPRVIVESAIDFTFMGIPFFHSMVARAQAFHSGISVLIDAETILLPDFLGILHYIQTLNHDWFLVAKPHCVSHLLFQSVGKGKHLSQGTGRFMEASKLQEHILKHNWTACGGRLLMAWNKGILPLHAGIMPPFIHGQGFHNEWFVNEVLASEFRIVFDSSLVPLSLYPTSLGERISNSLKDSENADKMSWMHSGNHQLSSLYGQLPFHQNKFSNGPTKIVKCLKEYYLVDRVEDGAYILQGSDGLETYSKYHHAQIKRLEIFTFFSRLLHLRQDKKLDACVKNIDALYPLYEFSLMKHHESASEKLSKLYMPFSLELLLRNNADKDKTIVLAVAGHNYRDMLMNWVCRLRNLAVKNFLVCALDSEIYHFSILQGLPVFKDPIAPSNISFSDCHFGTECFQRVTKVKSRIVLQILRLGYNVLMSDVDVYWFHNPLPYLLSFGPGVLVAQSDEYNKTGPVNMPRRLNSGFYFARSDLSTIAAMDMVVKHASTSKLSEQPSFYDVLCGEGGVNRVGDDKCQEPKTNLTVIFLDRNLFPNGAYRGIWEKHDVKSSCLKLGCLILHNNWISGRKKKFERQVSSGLWDYEPSSRMCLQSWHSKVY